MTVAARHISLIKTYMEMGRSPSNIAAALGLPEPEVAKIIADLKAKQQ